MKKAHPQNSSKRLQYISKANQTIPHFVSKQQIQEFKNGLHI
ncbi:hypothetical protein QWZ00_07580 [Belliella kenyensis]|nr:hypothetical protein [Belliella kenyensis]MDN3602974.1 hypothetical protein [Belliella kenyensis]